MNTPSRPWLLARRAFLTALLAGLVATQATAGPLNEYTGYSRPVDVPLEGSQKIDRGKVIGAAKERWEKGRLAKDIGGTVYFMVLDREKGVEGDTWGTGVKN